MSSAVRSNIGGEQVDVIRSSRRRKPSGRGDLDATSVRVRDLAAFTLDRNGFDVADIAWLLKISRAHAYRVVESARNAAEALGYGSPQAGE